jgi:hypothetical protein
MAVPTAGRKRLDHHTGVHGLGILQVRKHAGGWAVTQRRGGNSNQGEQEGSFSGPLKN